MDLWAMTELVLDLEPADRRKKRSQDPLIALHYQLAYARAYGELDAIVVADASGVVVAGAGSWAACEELAAYAPLLMDREAAAAASEEDGSRLAELRAEANVHPIDVEGEQVLLCARGGPKSPDQPQIRQSTVARAAEGVSRILRLVA
jgi:hypothetical protein